MRVVIQSKLMLMGGNQQETFGLFYAALTVHGQVMLVAVIFPTNVSFVTCRVYV